METIIIDNVKELNEYTGKLRSEGVVHKVVFDKEAKVWTVTLTGQKASRPTPSPRKDYTAVFKDSRGRVVGAGNVRYAPAPADVEAYLASR